jgi:hypothetical protein
MAADSTDAPLGYFVIGNSIGQAVIPSPSR